MVCETKKYCSLSYAKLYLYTLIHMYIHIALPRINGLWNNGTPLFVTTQCQTSGNDLVIKTSINYIILQELFFLTIICANTEASH